MPLAQLTGLRLTSHYRLLEQSGRKDHRKDHRAGEGLSARTVRYLHTIVHKVLGQAVKDGLLLRNPADAATPPSTREAKAPEMHPWDAAQLAAFLGWAATELQSYALAVLTWCAGGRVSVHYSPGRCSRPWLRGEMTMLSATAPAIWSSDR